MSEPAIIEPFKNYTHPLLQCGQLTIDRIQYNATQFDSALFHQLAIEQPPQIQRAVQKRQAEFFYGRLAARFSTERFGFTGNIPINPDRSPKWPEELHGSISHCQGEAIAVALPKISCTGVGIDIERIATGDAFSALKNMVVNTKELKRLQKYQSLYSEATLLTLVFSAKESFYKASYLQVQRFFGFETLQFRSLNADKQQISFTVMEGLSPQLRQGQQIVIDFCPPKQSIVVSGLALTSEKTINSLK